MFGCVVNVKTVKREKKETSARGIYIARCVAKLNKNINSGGEMDNKNSLVAALKREQLTILIQRERDIETTAKLRGVKENVTERDDEVNKEKIKKGAKGANTTDIESKAYSKRERMLEVEARSKQ